MTMIPAILLATAASEGDTAELPSFAGALWQMIVALTIVVAALIGTAVVVRRLRPRITGRVGVEGMRISERLHLDAKHRIYVVELRGESLVVGVAGESIALLARMQGAADDIGGSRSDQAASTRTEADRTPRTPAMLLNDAARSLISMAAGKAGAK